MFSNVLQSSACKCLCSITHFEWKEYSHYSLVTMPIIPKPMSQVRNSSTGSTKDHQKEFFILIPTGAAKFSNELMEKLEECNS
ncbi:hypothetical protein TNIN_306681 [Trichonephila inaurata madagascariensis]|uniref:Uncharacterized protein n=1 Tax=Trichonephila inaurata madagascariensis TaxID=2747483 RepID=A0A8X7CL39_9ARAC|nr:hypothetical protein TNIN_306681 [Trichonephila inaurata madagascariensis]